MRLGTVRLGAVALTALFGLVEGALAQRSLFDPPASPGAPAPAPAPGTSPSSPTAPYPGRRAKAKPKPKPRGPVPARVLTINNAGASTLTALEVSAEGKSARLAKPLGPKKKTSLKLPAFKGCSVSVSAAFEGQAVDATEVDICRDKVIRFTE